MYCISSSKFSSPSPLKTQTAISITRTCWSQKTKWLIAARLSSRTYRSVALNIRATAVERKTSSLTKSWWASLPKRWFQTGSDQIIRRPMAATTTGQLAVFPRIRAVPSKGITIRTLLFKIAGHRKVFQKATSRPPRVICLRNLRIGRSEWRTVFRTWSIHQTPIPTSPKNSWATSPLNTTHSVDIHKLWIRPPWCKSNMRPSNLVPTHPGREKRVVESQAWVIRVWEWLV